MRSTQSVVAVTLGLSLLAAPRAPAQDPPPGPPKILSIYREVVKPGKGAAHEKNEAAWAAAYAKATAPINYIAMTSVTGPAEAWFVEGRSDFSSIEKADQFIESNAALQAEVGAIAARDGELLDSSSHILAVLRDDLGYGSPVPIPKMRYFSVTTIRVKPGYGNEFATGSKVLKEAHEKAKLDERWAVYEVISGAPGGTFLVFQPMKSLAEMDAYREMHGKAFQDAMGEDNRARMRELTREAVASQTSQVFQLNPRMSAAAKEFVAGDPEFWTVKPAEAKKK